MAIRENSPQVLTTRPDGSDGRWLGRTGPVGALKYSSSLPGGAASLTCTVAVSPATRHTALDPGRHVHVYRGAGRVWAGKLDEPTPAESGWQVSARGLGALGSDYMAHYTSYSTAGDPVTHAVNDTGRGLPWRLPASWPSLYLSQPADDASQDITSYLNAVTGPVALTWQVAPSGTVSAFTPPTSPTRLLICPNPPTRTLYGYYTRIWIRYCSKADDATGGTAATYAVTSVTNTAQQAKHGSMELYADLSQAGVMSAGTAQATGTSLLARYRAASWAGPFTAAPGQVRTLGGTPVDLASEQAGECYQLVLAAGGYGGEVSPSMPATFLAGGYEYDDDSQRATITPYQYAANDLAGLLSSWATLHTPPPTTS